MDAVAEITQQELGRRLMQVREAAGLKQAELARKITWSQAVLSRVESGERELSDDELKTVMEAIGTPEALQLSKSLGREWRDAAQAPTQIAYGAKVTVRASDTAGISKVVLMRPGAATHGFDQDQRYVGVNFTVKGATKLKVTGPASGSIAPPGYYMLFLVNSAGVPSVAKFIHVG
jgi:transcriptional regulator with XRE-family HTH domain